MEQNDLVLNSLNEFVEKNKVRISEIKIENPPLHTAVLYALVFLNKRFGNVDIKKEELIPEEPLEELSKSKQKLFPTTVPKFKVGDRFSNINSLDEFIEINNIYKNEVQEINDYIDSGVFVEYKSTPTQVIPKFKVGQEFKVNGFGSEYMQIFYIGNSDASLIIRNKNNGLSRRSEESIKNINGFIENGDWILRQTTQVQTPAPIKKPRAKNPNQARIKEIKESIEGLQLLADMGDTDAQD